MPIAEALPGIDLVPLEDTAVPLAAVVLVKALDAEGRSSWYVRRSAALDEAEVLGVLIMEADRVRRGAAEGWVDDGDDER